jgi:hypothetical protein
MASLSCLVVARSVVTVIGVVPRQLGLQWTSQCSSGVFVRVALAFLPALCWRYHQHRAVVFTGVAPASLSVLVGIFALIALDLSPTLHPRCRYYCKLASTPSRCNRDTSAYVALSLCSLTSSVVFVAITGAVPWRLGLHIRPILHWWFLLALRRHHHPRCTGVLASIVLLSFSGVVLALSPMLHWPLCPHCAGIAPSIAN